MMTSSARSSSDKRKATKCHHQQQCYDDDDDDNIQVMTSQYRRKQQGKHQLHLLVCIGCTTFFVIASLGFIFVSYLHMGGAVYHHQPSEIVLTEDDNDELVEPMAMELKDGNDNNNDNRKINNIHKRQIWVDKKDRKPEVGNLMYVKGSKSYKEAFYECKQRGARLALLDDLERAYSLGYHNCKRGWLLDKHTGYVVQKDDPPSKCKTTQAGVIYSSTTTKHRSYGAYCTYRKWFSPVNPQQKLVPSLNLWFRKDPAHLYKLRKDLQKKKTGGMLTSIRALYPCCNYLNVVPVVNQDGNTVTMVQMTKRERSMRYLVKLAREIFPESKPKIMPHIRMSYKAMYHHGAGSWNKSAVVEDIVSRAVTSKVDGFMFDYEPHHDYTEKHAMMVKDFLNLLAEKMHANHLELGFCISDWGILKFYDVYAESNVDVFATMSVTYYGRDVAKNKVGVKKLLRAIDAQRVQIGIKSAVREPKDPVTGEIPQTSYKKPSRWTHHRLKNFLRWVARYTDIAAARVAGELGSEEPDQGLLLPDPERIHQGSGERYGDHHQYSDAADQKTQDDKDKVDQKNKDGEKVKANKGTQESKDAQEGEKEEEKEEEEKKT